MDKRALIGIALSVLVLVGYQEFITRYYGPPPTVPAPAAEKTDAAPPANTAAPSGVTPAVPAALPAQVAPAIAPPNQAARNIQVETDNYIAVFTSHGARLKSFQFKNYRASADPNSPLQEMITTAKDVPLPLGVRWQAPAPFDDAGLSYSVQGADLKLTGEARGTLVFQGQTADGVTITKSLTFTGNLYPIQFDVAVQSAAGNAPVPEILLTDKSDHTVPNPGAPFEGFIALVDNKIKREAKVDASNGHEFSGDVAWAGFGYTYFFVALMPENSAGHKVSVRQNGAALIAALSGPAATDRYRLFIGPKELELLKSVGKDIDRAIDHGYFGFVSVPLLYVLHFFHRFTGSYGVDIIILTVLIKLIMWPLTHKSFSSMKSMQKLGPQMEKLKERYANDKEKLNKEIMDLYKRNGVNPLGGCLPMALQFPVFIGLYNALSTPIELRHAPFLWVKDLSRPDWEALQFAVPAWWPSFLPSGIPILTIVMGATMFIQQWMTPSAGDPNQRRMMMLMPLMFTFMFVSFPAGLTVYWLVNNVLSIAQQYWINRSDK
jgi:YidC/Oxa1 family membrane protein insertase